MFRASSCPSSEATTTAVAASGLPSELGDGSAVGRGRAGRPSENEPATLRLVAQCLNQLRHHVPNNHNNIFGNSFKAIKNALNYFNP